MRTVAELFAQLEGDAWRVTHPFTSDILEANALLHNTAATEEEMAECLSLWCGRMQPCQFGRVAAKQGRIHFCLLRETFLTDWDDEAIADKITEEKRLWKQRAACDVERGAHSFVIVVASSRVALAAPDRNLRTFSDRILELAGWEADHRGVRRKNTVTSDYLYLRKPVDGAFYGFRFNADFFACAGDGRWWHDHRFPGGIAITANSTGHMMRFREWYQAKPDGEAWGLKQAMLTIQNAAPASVRQASATSHEGRVTWLRDLDQGGKPLVENVKCPISIVPSTLAGKDWTRYEGLLHTDHAVREEFFLDRDTAPTASRPYLMDLTYLFDTGQAEFVDFSSGRLFSDQEVQAEIGKPEEWTHRSHTAAISRSEEQAAHVAQQLLACTAWESPQWYVLDRDEER